MTQPLLGAVDTAVIGQLGIAELIGGVAIGTIIMNTMYWLFGFSVSVPRGKARWHWVRETALIWRVA